MLASTPADSAPLAVDPAASNANSLMGEDRPDAKSFRPRSRSMRLSLLGLILAVLGIGLAVIPSIAMERALPNPFESKEEAQRRLDGPPQKEGGITLRLKNFSINFFGKDVKKPAPVPPAFTQDPVRWLMIAGCVFALISLIVSSVAHIREQHGFMTFIAMSCSIVALTWQFLAFGIMLGTIAIVFFLIARIVIR